MKRTVQSSYRNSDYKLLEQGKVISRLDVYLVYVLAGPFKMLFEHQFL